MQCLRCAWRCGDVVTHHVLRAFTTRQGKHQCHGRKGKRKCDGRKRPFLLQSCMSCSVHGDREAKSEAQLRSPSSSFSMYLAIKAQFKVREKQVAHRPKRFMMRFFGPCPRPSNNRPSGSSSSLSASSLLEAPPLAQSSQSIVSSMCESMSKPAAPAVS